METLSKLIALSILIAWPVIPLFWIPVHLFHGFFKRYLGMLTYAVIAIVWLPCAWLVFHYRGVLLQHRLDLPFWAEAGGWLLFLGGCALQYWTARVMGPVIIGMPEVTDVMESTHVVQPPFNWCRHPTYLAHTMIFGGAALLTGYAVLFLLTALDAAAVHLFIIPFEERELVKRLGHGYMEYIETTPRFMPSIRNVLGFTASGKRRS